MKNYISNVLDPSTTPQSEALPDKKQVKNSAGGFVFAVTPWTRLERFLVLGSEGGSYYASERDLTKSNIDGLKAALAEDGKKFVDTVAQISHAGRAPKNDPALFALALAVADKRKDVSAYALSKLPDVARIPTHLFSFAQYVQSLRGWGRALRNGVADWYLSKPADKLAYQLAKYQSRNGWSNADLLRLSHANPELQPDHKILLNWAVKGWESVGDEPHSSKAILPVWAFEKAKRLTPPTGVKELVRLITDYDLPRECIPTEFLSQVEVWDALLQKMPMTAMIRNLGKMTSIGLLSPNSEAAKMIGKRLEARTAPQGTDSSYLCADGSVSLQGRSWTQGQPFLDSCTACRKRIGEVFLRFICQCAKDGQEILHRLGRFRFDGKWQCGRNSSYAS